MKARARILGHPIHQMLIVFPLGLLSTGFAFDLAHQLSGDLRWADIAYWMIVAGLIGGAVAAVFGVIDFLAIPARTRARRIGLLHGGGNVVVMLLFLTSLLLRTQGQPVPASAMVCAALGVGIALITGWLGGELVVRLGIGVDEGANLNAPSSLHSGAEHRMPS